MNHNHGYIQVILGPMV